MSKFEPYPFITLKDCNALTTDGLDVQGEYITNCYPLAHPKSKTYCIKDIEALIVTEHNHEEEHVLNLIQIWYEGQWIFVGLMGLEFTKDLAMQCLNNGIAEVIVG